MHLEGLCDSSENKEVMRRKYNVYKLRFDSWDQTPTKAYIILNKLFNKCYFNGC